jgi:hypothetical protein
VGPFLADDDTHPGRPAAQVHQAGQFGDPGAVTDLVVGVVGRGPPVLRDVGEQVGRVRRQGEPDRIRQALAGEPLDQLLGAAGAAGADQDLASGALSGPLSGQLREGLSDDGDVVGGGVRAGVAGPQQDGEGFAGAVGAVDNLSRFLCARS